MATQAAATRTLKTTEAAVLALLAIEGERSGYDLLKLVSQAIGYVWAPARSQLYAVLPRLAKDSLAAQRRVGQEKRPDNVLYRITEDGRSTLARWLETVEPGAVDSLYLRLFVGGLTSIDTLLEHAEQFKPDTEPSTGRSSPRTPAPDTTSSTTSCSGWASSEPSTRCGGRTGSSASCGRPAREPPGRPRRARPAMRRTLSVLAVAGALLGCVAAQAETGGLFAYDASRPLQVRQAGSTESGGVRVVELSYASPKGGRVPATLVLPAAEGWYPAVVFQHGAGSARRSDFRVEAEDLARAGLASLLVDAPFNRPPYRPWLTFQTRDRAAYVRNVIDLRRALDLLSARPEVDPQRLALAGFSYGGVLAGIVAGLERRLAAVVVMSGPGRITDALRREGRRQRVAPRQLARYLASMRAVDAVGYVGRANAPLLFQFGRQDTMPRAWFTKYVAAAPASTRVVWYPAGHLLCDCATRDRKAWLLEQLVRAP